MSKSKEQQALEVLQSQTPLDQEGWHDNPICPYCLRPHEGFWLELDELYDGEDHEVGCYHCQRVYLTEISLTVKYKFTPLSAEARKELDREWTG